MKDFKLDFILKTATELFMTRGIGDVTIKDIADEAGIGDKGGRIRQGSGSS